jgi:hypothetical protein
MRWCEDRDVAGCDKALHLHTVDLLQRSQQRHIMPAWLPKDVLAGSDLAETRTRCI